MKRKLHFGTKISKPNQSHLGGIQRLFSVKYLFNEQMSELENATHMLQINPLAVGTGVYYFSYQSIKISFDLHQGLYASACILHALLRLRSKF